MMLILGAIYLFVGMILGDTFVQTLGATVLAVLLCGWGLLWLAGRLYVSLVRVSGGSSQNSRPLD